jgi:hypothetical protein
MGSECGHGRGSKRGARHVGGRRGREIQRRARVRTHRSTAGAGRANLKGRVPGVEREKRDTRGNNSAPGEPGPRDRERRDARPKKLAPTGRPHWAASERGRASGRESCR